MFVRKDGKQPEEYTTQQPRRPLSNSHHRPWKPVILQTAVFTSTNNKLKHVDCGLLDCCAVLSCRWMPTFSDECIDSIFKADFYPLIFKIVFYSEMIWSVALIFGSQDVHAVVERELQINKNEGRKNKRHFTTSTWDAVKTNTPARNFMCAFSFEQCLILQKYWDIHTRSFLCGIKLDCLSEGK